LAGHQRASWAKIRIPARVVLRIFHRKVAVRNRKLKDSVIRRRRAREHMSVAAQSIGQRPLARLRVNRAAREKEGRALMVNPAGHHHQEAERPLLASQPEAERLRKEPNAARNSHNTARNNQRKERHGQGRNNSGIICNTAGSGECPTIIRRSELHLGLRL
jgi:hypothetical protein